MCQIARGPTKAFTLASWFPPSHPMQIRFSDLQVLVFEQSMCHTASPPTHCLSPVADHSTRPISPRHRKPPCCHPSTTHPAGGGALSQGPDGARRSTGPCASGHPPIRLQSGTSSGGQRLLCRGEGNLGRLVLLLGAVLLGGDVDVGSWWKLNKWFNSDAFLKGDLTSLGKSVVKIRKMMFYSVFFL